MNVHIDAQLIHGKICSRVASRLMKLHETHPVESKPQKDNKRC